MQISVCMHVATSVLVHATGNWLAVYYSVMESGKGHQSCTMFYIRAGEEHLAFDGDFLVMDWNNDSREKESVQVTPKEILVGDLF